MSILVLDFAYFNPLSNIASENLSKSLVVLNLSRLGVFFQFRQFMCQSQFF